MTRITTAVRRELVRVLRERYREGKREERQQILEELVRLSGIHPTCNYGAQRTERNFDRERRWRQARPSEPV